MEATDLCCGSESEGQDHSFLERGSGHLGFSCGAFLSMGFVRKTLSALLDATLESACSAPPPKMPSIQESRSVTRQGHEAICRQGIAQLHEELVR